MEKAFPGRRQAFSKTEKRFSMGYQQISVALRNDPLSAFVCLSLVFIGICLRMNF